MAASHQERSSCSCRSNGLPKPARTLHWHGNSGPETSAPAVELTKVCTTVHYSKAVSQDCYIFCSVLSLKHTESQPTSTADTVLEWSLTSAICDADSEGELAVVAGIVSSAPMLGKSRAATMRIHPVCAAHGNTPDAPCARVSALSTATVLQSLELYHTIQSLGSEKRGTQ